MKIIFSILIMIGVVGISACSSGKQYMEGTICKIGNEPFTKMAIQTDIYTVYTITAAEEILRELEQQQGYKMKIFYSKIDSSLGVKNIILKSHELINK